MQQIHCPVCLGDAKTVGASGEMEVYECEACGERFAVYPKREGSEVIRDMEGWLRHAEDHHVARTLFRNGGEILLHDGRAVEVRIGGRRANNILARSAERLLREAAERRASREAREGGAE